ncbi:unnamed protein product, partial [Rotaria socialis]
MFNDSVTVNIPLKSDDDTEANINNDPPAYQNPHLDFNEGRKDFSIAIVFGIHIIVVIVVGIVLGLPIVLQHMKQISLAKRLRLSADFGIKHFVYSLSGAAVVGGLLSFLTFFALQLCAGHFIKCSFFMLTMMQIL